MTFTETASSESTIKRERSPLNAKSNSRMPDLAQILDLTEKDRAMLRRRKRERRERELARHPNHEVQEGG